MNEDLRMAIAELVKNAGEGHIPSGYSIVDIVDTLYGRFLKYDSHNPAWEERDYFILSKGHGSAALYVVLQKYGFISKSDLQQKSQTGGILGGHPDSTKVPGVEASTGSLGHGVVTAMGIALGLRIQDRPNRVVALIGDGESNEGTVWETALVAANLKLGNFCVIVDRNKSIDQILAMPKLGEKWRSFGWGVQEIDGHSECEIEETIKRVNFVHVGQPNIIIANTVKGKGVSFMEAHGPWHHKVPSVADMKAIRAELA
jgi:transketolase